jgi:ABC-type glycerol-3-phosphate transport system permease component
MLIPSVLVLIPLWFQLRQLGRDLLGSNSAITDSIFTLSLVYAVQGLPGHIFLMVGFMRRINNSFIEAALMDGAGETRIFTTIIIPRTKKSFNIRFHPSSRYSNNEIRKRNISNSQPINNPF